MSQQIPAHFLSLPGVWAVLDPVGVAGVAALGVARQALEGALGKGAPSGPALVAAIEQANGALHAASEAQPTLRGSGCTLAALGLASGAANIAWVGDVRVFKLRDGQLTTLTTNHSLANEYARRGVAAPGGKTPEKWRHIIVRALGMRDTLEVETVSEPAAAGDIFVLASGDVYEALGEGLLTMTLARLRQTPDACVSSLLEDARVNGGDGPLTAFIVIIAAGDSAPATSGASLPPERPEPRGKGA